MKKVYKVTRPNATIKVDGEDKETGDTFEADENSELVEQLKDDDSIEEFNDDKKEELDE